MTTRVRALLLALLVLAGPPAPPPQASAAAPVRLPAPTGRFAVGTVAVHLVDRDRRDPWKPERARELMVSLWYPAGRGGSGPAPQMTPKAAAHFGSATGAGTINLGVPAGAADWGATVGAARTGAPLDRRAGRPPVVLYSPGLGDPRTWNTALVQDLASRGYAVVTIDHTYESSEVEFPGGRLATSTLLESPPPTTPGEIAALLKKAMAARVADTRFVLDRLPGLDRRHFGGALDLRRVGMAGHSAGGFAAAQVMHDDRRVRAGINMDGQMDFPDGSLSTVARDGLDRPLLFLRSDGNESVEPSWAEFRRHTRGWTASMLLRGSRHASFTDASAVLPALARRGVEPSGGLAAAIGTVAPERAIAFQRTRTAAFFDRWLRHEPS
ncbi:alpha/beta hydrolase family protein [Actinomadura algeriensis]|uniref:Dienelactone hydrolase n=1 Tax=Actinomadura algeriensis TaxID=1679523 RepID=A0ABR9JMT4_9ACTN|nr:esterase [Actinomadura algeriensis]MBE1531847.1 putative dienelactone hydrolase [Actinomadura algeriensis]